MVILEHIRLGSHGAGARPHGTGARRSPFLRRASGQTNRRNP
jgi:hypothetical protein